MGRKLLKTVQTITTFRNPLADPVGTRRGPPLVRGPQFENRCSSASNSPFTQFMSSDASSFVYSKHSCYSNGCYSNGNQRLHRCCQLEQNVKLSIVMHSVGGSGFPFGHRRNHGWKVERDLTWGGCQIPSFSSSIPSPSPFVSPPMLHPFLSLLFFPSALKNLTRRSGEASHSAQRKNDG